MPDQEHEKRGEEEVSRQAKRKAAEDKKAKLESADKVIEADVESFPASDAPSWTQNASGRPHYDPSSDVEKGREVKEPPRE